MRYVVPNLVQINHFFVVVNIEDIPILQSCINPIELKKNGRKKSHYSCKILKIIATLPFFCTFDVSHHKLFPSDVTSIVSSAENKC